MVAIPDAENSNESSTTTLLSTTSSVEEGDLETTEEKTLEKRKQTERGFHTSQPLLTKVLSDIKSFSGTYLYTYCLICSIYIYDNFSRWR